MKGICIAIRSERNLRMHLVAAILVLLLGIICKLSSGEWALLCIVIGIIITAELFNSAIELISNFISPGHHKEIEKIKDISAGAVLVAAIAAVAGGIFIFWPHLTILFSHR